MSRPKPPQLQCAIYTRKSTEEGVGQSFSTLDAQREACEAYIRSQAGEGWIAVPRLYDDGGFSGGNLERPAIQRLLKDVDCGRVDIIVVYKVDRLTRSLMDFAKIVERLDARGVSFVSVTQAFNTTSSMGRLTLNVLLSFAQFEREVTGERIRDKIAASKAKGMWMGGSVPLGYDLRERHLVVNEVEAGHVRHIFARYAALESAVKVVRELRRDGICTKRRLTRSGQPSGGLPFSCGGVYYILQNRLYLGDIVHRGYAHAGAHEAIVDRQLFDRAQQLLAANRGKRWQRTKRPTQYPLAGLALHRSRGALTTSFSYGRGGRMYRYYVAGTLDPTRSDRGQRPLRIPAAPLETLVLGILTKIQGHKADWNQFRSLIRRVEIADDSIQLVLRSEAFLATGEDRTAIVSQLHARIGGDRLSVRYYKRELRVVFEREPASRAWCINCCSAAGRTNNDTIGRRLQTAHRLLEQHNLSPLNPERHPEAFAPANQRSRHLMALGLLAPTVQKDLLKGNCEITGLETVAQLPLAWTDQVELLIGSGPRPLNGVRPPSHDRAQDRAQKLPPLLESCDRAGGLPR
jgi:site-specific DNA recombinase